MKRVLVTGGSGFIGKNLVPVLNNDYQLFAFGSKDYDLTVGEQCDQMFRNYKPEVVVHLAAKSGGILANKLNSAEFFHQNMLITGNIWEYSKRYGVNKVIAIVPSCTYPAKAPVPIQEVSIWDGFCDILPAAGALPKKMSIAASYAYKKQHGLNSCVLIPSNCFGCHDLFDEGKSHVIDSLILKIQKAKNNNDKEIQLLGDGSPIRDFLYVEDLAKVIPYFIENDINFPSDNPCLENVVNISTGKGTSIKELSETVCDVIGYSGEIRWSDSSMNGPANKTLDNQRMKSLGLDCPTSLRDGLEKTYQWFVNR